MLNELSFAIKVLWLTLIGRRSDVLELSEWVSQSNGALSKPVQLAVNYGYHFWALFFACAIYGIFKLLTRESQAQAS